MERRRIKMYMRNNKNAYKKASTMKRVLGIILLLLFVSCATQKSEAIKIGGAFALTGDAAEWGNDEYKAAQLAVDEANAASSTQIQLVVEDTATDAKGTLNAVQKLISVDEVPVIVGPTWGDSFAQSIAPLSDEDQVILLTPSGAVEVVEAEQDYPYFYSTFYPQKVEMDTHMAFLRRHNYTRVAVVYDQDPFNTATAEAYMQAAKEQGIETYPFVMALGDNDFRTTLVKVREKNPDHVFSIIFDVGNFGAMLKSMHELGMTQTLSSTASAGNNNLIATYGQYAEGKVYFSAPDLSSDAYKQFEERFERKYGQKPGSTTAANAYDATNIIITALRNGARTGPEIKAQLDRISIPGTFVDEIKFTPSGQIDHATYTVKTVRNQTFVKE
jgi:branched-chain amino acid transport system substrate-binding protein